MNLVVFVGSGSGKVSRQFLKELSHCRTNLFTACAVKNIDEFSQLIEAVYNQYLHVVVFPIYCEDFNLSRTYKIDFVYQIENICEKYKKCIVLHGSVIGNILGNKQLTNIFFTSKNVACPALLTSNKSGKKIFSNELSSSHDKTNLIEIDAEINLNKYNTQYIDTRFQFGNEEYYACIRTMCIGEVITDIFLRFRNVRDNDPNVHGNNTPMCPDLQNFYFKNILHPHIGKLKQMCVDIGLILGLGFYAHDIMLCSETHNFYVAESSLKFDNILMWKKKINKILPFIEHEKTIQDSIDNAKYVFCNQMDSFLLKI